jgi:hypothetical protein
MAENPISAKARQELARREKHALFPYLIHIEHEDFGSFYYANSSDSITYNGHVYEAATFSIDPPDRDGSKIGNALITISDVNQLWVQRIRSTRKTAKIHFVAGIKYSDNGQIRFEILEKNSFTLRLATYNGVIVTWEMEFDLTQTYILNGVSASAAIAPGCA